MSRIGKKLIIIPEGVDIKEEAGKIIVKGLKGELVFGIFPEIKVELNADNEKKIRISLNDEKSANAKKMWGTTRAIINNMIEGVTSGFQKKLEIEGVGFRASVDEASLVLNIGYSHPVKLKIPAGLKVTVEKNVIVISGIDKNSVGQFAANVRKQKKPEPYKGKGIRYQGEVIRRKLGKKAVSAGK